MKLKAVTQQDLQNDVAARLGRLVRVTAALPNSVAGDDIDRGLILVRSLRQEGLLLAVEERE
jgi:hypothetical protein